MDRQFLAAFGKYDDAEYFVDSDHPGWLVWGKSFNAFRSAPKRFVGYDDTEKRARAQMGKMPDKGLVPPVLSNTSSRSPARLQTRFRMHHVVALMQCFDLVNYDESAATLDDIQGPCQGAVRGRAATNTSTAPTAEVLGAMLTAGSDDPVDIREKVWGFAAPMMLKIFADDLTPDNLQYWMTCLHLTVDGKDTAQGQGGHRDPVRLQARHRVQRSLQGVVQGAAARVHH